MSVATLALSKAEDQVLRDIQADLVIDGRGNKIVTLQKLERLKLLTIKPTSVFLTKLGEKYLAQSPGE